MLPSSSDMLGMQGVLACNSPAAPVAGWLQFGGPSFSRARLPACSSCLCDLLEALRVQCRVVLHVALLALQEFELSESDLEGQQLQLK